MAITRNACFGVILMARAAKLGYISDAPLNFALQFGTAGTSPSGSFVVHQHVALAKGNAQLLALGRT
jgi:hypothetical protein